MIYFDKYTKKVVGCDSSGAKESMQCSSCPSPAFFGVATIRSGT